MSARARSRQGTCSVENDRVVEEMKFDTEDHINRNYREATPCSSRRSVPKRSNTMQSKRSVMQELVKQTLEQQKWIDEKRIREIQEKADSEARGTRQMYESVIETENTFVKEMADFLAKKEMLNQRKRELLHKRWTENVNEPIRREVVSELNSPNYDEFVRRKRELYKEYLEHSNRKGHVFLDVISPEEYYPLTLHPTRPSLLKMVPAAVLMPRAATPKLRDPLLKAERDRCAEERVVFRCMTGSEVTDKDIAAISLPPLPLRPLGRHGTECHTWQNMNLYDIESAARLASSYRPERFVHGASLPLHPFANRPSRRMYGNFNHSDLGIENWGKIPPRPPVEERRRPDTIAQGKCDTPPSWSKVDVAEDEKTAVPPPPTPQESNTDVRDQPAEYVKKVIRSAAVAV